MYLRWHGKFCHRIFLTSKTIETFGIPGQFKKNTKQDSQSVNWQSNKKIV